MITLNKSFYKISEIHQSHKSVIQTMFELEKAHSADIKVETKEGKGTTFITTIPSI